MDKKTNLSTINSACNSENDQFTFTANFPRTISRKTDYFSATIALVVGWVFIKNYAMFFKSGPVFLSNHFDYDVY